MQDSGGALAARNITKSYGAEVVLDRVSLTVTGRARLGVVGPNGSGKSTLLRILAGVEAPDSGDVAAAEQELDALAARLESEPELATAYTDALERG